MTRHRYRLGRHTGPWRDTADEALADAVEAGFARYDERYGKIMKDEMLRVEEGR